MMIYQVSAFKIICCVFYERFCKMLLLLNQNSLTSIFVHFRLLSTTSASNYIEKGRENWWSNIFKTYLSQNRSNQVFCIGESVLCSP